VTRQAGHFMHLYLSAEQSVFPVHAPPEGYEVEVAGAPGRIKLTALYEPADGGPRKQIFFDTADGILMNVTGVGSDGLLAGLADLSNWSYFSAAGRPSIQRWLGQALPTLSPAVSRFKHD